MCVDSDLFGDIVVTVTDVDLWLDSVPILQGRSHSSREIYAKNYDIANKIKASKLDGSFYLLINKLEQERLYTTESVHLFDVVHVPDYVKSSCPDYFHICSCKDCPAYIKRLYIQTQLVPVN